MTLPHVTHEHHRVLIPHVDALLAVAEMVERAPVEDLMSKLDAEYSFVIGQLVPHMEAVERSLYPELQRLLQNPRAMGPMQREHEAVRRLIDELGHLRDRLLESGLNHGEMLQLRRVLIRLFAILKVHLYEEEEYAPIVQRNVTPARASELAAAMEHAMREPL
jgi:iron-sulfur cluster repair protein YtfE (RIC family)